MKLFTTCVRYADFLAPSLAEWKKRGEVHVITRIDDEDTRVLCNQFDVTAVFTGAWWFHESNDGLNKGAAQQDAVDRYAVHGEQIVMFDADCYPVGNIPEVTDPDIILSCRRFMCHTAEEHRRRIEDPAFPLRELPNNPSYRPHLVRGYFQTFQYQSRLKFGRKRDKTFSGCDLYLASQFLYNLIVPVEEFHVLHLGQPKVNWKGRITEEWK